MILILLMSCSTRAYCTLKFLDWNCKISNLFLLTFWIKYDWSEATALHIKVLI
jgi:hypothetical protein